NGGAVEISRTCPIGGRVHTGSDEMTGQQCKTLIACATTDELTLFGTAATKNLFDLQAPWHICEQLALRPAPHGLERFRGRQEPRAAASHDEEFKARSVG